MREHVLPAGAGHAEACAPRRNRLHAAVPRQAQKRAVVGLQLHHAAAAGNNLKQTVAGRTFRIRFERRRAISSESQELAVARLSANA